MCPMLRAGSQFLGGGRLAAPVPALGAELLTNPGFETWTTDTDIANWTESVAGTSAVGKEATEIHGGTYACKHVIDGTSGACYIAQSVTCTAGKWYESSVWVKADSITAAKFKHMDSNAAYFIYTPTTTWQRFLVIARTTATGGKFLIFTKDTSAQNRTFYLDDASVKEITLASMFSTRPYSTHATTKAMATVVSGTRAGVVANLDSATVPANFVIASHDGTTARLTKCVAGTYTELVSTAVAYSAGAYVEIRRLATTDTWQLWYNGAQVGTDQTISDAAIKAATLAGMFNSYGGNTLAAFSCIPSA